MKRGGLQWPPPDPETDNTLILVHSLDANKECLGTKGCHRRERCDKTREKPQGRSRHPGTLSFPARRYEKTREIPRPSNTDGEEPQGEPCGAHGPKAKADPSVATTPAREHRFKRASALALGHACRGPRRRGDLVMTTGGFCERANWPRPPSAVMCRKGDSLTWRSDGY
jgi:hypothetical protein